MDTICRVLDWVGLLGEDRPEGPRAHGPSHIAGRLCGDAPMDSAHVGQSASKRVSLRGRCRASHRRRHNWAKRVCGGGSVASGAGYRMIRR